MSNTTGMRVLFSGHATSRVVCSAVLHALDSACDGGVLAHAQRGSSGEKAAGPSTRKRQASRKRRALLDILEQVLQDPVLLAHVRWLCCLGHVCAVHTAVLSIGPSLTNSQYFVATGQILQSGISRLF